jgi:hypothetical protein
MDLYCKCWSPIVLYVILNLSSRNRQDESVIPQPVSRHCNSLVYSRLNKRRQGQRWSLSGGIIERIFSSLYFVTMPTFTMAYGYTYRWNPRERFEVERRCEITIMRGAALIGLDIVI